MAILGTGLIGASVGLALRSHGYSGSITGWDPSPEQLHAAFRREAITVIADDPLAAATEADLTILSGPVFTILEWLDRLAPVLREDQLVTDVGSVKGAICAGARDKYNGPGQPGFLPGHPMAGKEVSGAENADANLFSGAVWLFAEPRQTDVILSEAGLAPAKPAQSKDLPSTQEFRRGAVSEMARAAELSPPAVSSPPHRLAYEWRNWVEKFGARILSIDPERHDILCAWISHLPQFVSTAMCALLEDECAANANLLPIGGRALREMTRLGASPFSMWRDIAHTNTDAIAQTLHALEQRLAHIRENLKTPELRDEFDRANRFRLRDPGKS